MTVPVTYPIPINNRMPLDLSVTWQETANAPVGETVLLTDSGKGWIWLGSRSDEQIPMPSLNGRDAAFWAEPPAA